MYQITTGLMEAMLAAFKDELDSGYCYVFAGPVPANAGAALDVSTQHTQIARFTESGDGTTGLTFESPVGDLLTKSEAETWEGVIAFDGFEDAESTLTPTFFRFCPSGDDGRSAADTPRLQGTVGGPSSGADMRLTSATATANGTNRIGVAVFEVTQGAA